MWWVTILWAATMFSWWNRSWYPYSQFFFKFCWIFLLCHWKINFDHILEFIFCPPCNCCCFQIRRSFCLFWSATESVIPTLSLETKISADSWRKTRRPFFNVNLKTHHMTICLAKQKSSADVHNNSTRSVWRYILPRKHNGSS